MILIMPFYSIILAELWKNQAMLHLILLSRGVIGYTHGILHTQVPMWLTLDSATRFSNSKKNLPSKTLA